MVSVKDEQATGARTTARERVLDAARTLFSENGVSGTSLQMIADHLGVTKAAVYHQFHAKEEIVLALLEKPLAELGPIVARAEAMPTRETQLDVLLRGLVDVVLENPSVIAMIQADPAATRVIEARLEYHELTERVGELLAGPHPDAAARLASMLYGAGLMFLGHHPFLGEMDPEDLREQLPLIGKRMLLPPARAGGSRAS